VDDGVFAEILQRLQNLPSKLVDQVERHPTKSGVAQKLVEIMRKTRENEDGVTPVFEKVLEFHDVALAERVEFPQGHKQVNLRVGLPLEGALTLNDFECYVLVCDLVVRTEHLAKRALSHATSNDVSAKYFLAWGDDIIVVIVHPPSFVSIG